MITIRPAEDRGFDNRDWIKSRFTFSFGNYLDRTFHHFRSLRVINEDKLQPGKGFSMHPHRDMEILTWVLSGALKHRDSYDNEGVVSPDHVQLMSAGIGIEHSEVNPSPGEICHLLQIWLFPDEPGGPPNYAQGHFPAANRQNRFQLIASPDGAEGSLVWRSSTRLTALILEEGRSHRASLDPDRKDWIHVVRGKVRVNGESLKGGDGIALTAETHLTLEALTECEVLRFELS